MRKNRIPPSEKISREIKEAIASLDNGNNTRAILGELFEVSICEFDEVLQ